ncbi:MAG: HYR domain-containing protein, partial [Bacteroidia bacterium]|nr:HYR domain-containing protein [Bacteroidia bacterium]
ITVKDDTAPVWDFGCQIATTYTTNGGADCPADAAISLNVGDEISVNTTWSVGGITVPNLSGCVSDNCSAASNLIIRVTGKSDDNAGACQQTLSVTFEAEDECGNRAGGFTCVYIFVDDTAPVPPTPPADVTVQCADDVPAPVDLTAVDNCAGPITVSPTVVVTSGSCLNEFSEVRTWTFSDGCGNTSTVSQTITVKDDTAPVWDFGCEITTTYTTNGGADCPADAAISLNVGDEISVNQTWTVGGISVPNLSGCVSDNCSAASNLILRVIGKTDDNADICQQTLSITFEAEDECGNIAGGFTCTYVFVDDTDPVITFCPPDITVESEPGECVNTVDIGQALATDNCDPAVSVTNDAPGEFPFGETVVTWTATDACGNSSSCTQTVIVEKINTITEVTVTPSTQQYSDEVTFEASINPGDCPGANGAAAVKVEFFVGSQSMGTADLNLVGEKLVGTLTTALLESPNNPFDASDELGPGLKTVTAEFQGVNPNYNVSNPTTDLEITQEDALVDYTGQTLQATESSNSGNATVPLCVNVQDIADGYRGDIRNATLTIVNRDLPTTDPNYVIYGPVQVADLVFADDETLGTVCYDWNVDIGNQDAIPYTVGFIVDNYYTRNSSEDNTVITVYKPKGDFITGGGFIIPDSSEGEYASTPGLKTNFGFNVKYNKKGTKVQGRVNIIFRVEQPDGSIRVYQIKSNAKPAFGVDISDPNFDFAEFTAKANLSDVTDPLNPISLGGNLTLKVEMTDWGEPGDQDSIGINLTNNSGTLLYSSNWNGTSTDELILSGGNIVIHSGFSSKAPEANQGDQPIFSLSADQNPFDVQGDVTLESDDKSNLVTYSVYDSNNKFLYDRTLAPDKKFKFGQGIKSGMYLVIVRQGDKIGQIRMIKK